MSENFFKSCRDDLGISQAEVVFRFLPSRITVSAVSGWERGQVPNIEHVDDMVRVYKVSREKILEAIYEMAKERREEATAGAK